MCFRLQINTQGILTFGTELNGFLNSPFPLEYASIAPFYSNVDTTNAGPETSISFSTISSERNTRLAYEAVRRNFPIGNDFRVVSVAVATWENVGHYRENNTEQNTFQVSLSNCIFNFEFLFGRLKINNLNVCAANFDNKQQQNTQVAIICGEHDTFVEFLYPSNGLNWLQGDQGESGLPDIRAQVGFIAEDGRHFTVSGSGTDNVSNFHQIC